MKKKGCVYGFGMAIIASYVWIVDLNMLLCRMGIQYVQSGQYLLYADYARQGLAKNRSFEYHSADGELKTKTYLVWTERGRNFIHQLVGSPQIAQINTDVLN